VTMPAAFTISGTVRDAETGEPIPQFRIVTGWPQFDFLTGTTNAHWSTLDRFWLNFEGGKFNHTYEEPVLGGTPNPGYMFKFQAEGYAPVVSRPVAASERGAHFEITLRRAKTSSVSILLPDGRPAARAEIGLVSPTSELRLAPGAFDRSTSIQAANVLTADENGNFTLALEPDVNRLIVAHPAGFGMTTPAALATSPVIQLQPWGRLEGTFLSGSDAAPGRSVLFEFEHGNYLSISMDFSSYQTKTDNQGGFVFPQVPPGKHSVVELTPQRQPSGATAWSHNRIADVEILPGETTRVTLGLQTVP